jgi:anti-anti-sigma regulatory factor
MRQTEEAIFRFEGRFDGAAALRLREQMQIDGRPRAILDFFHVENFDDSTLALLAVHLVLLRRNGSEIVLRGLREHQLRMLHHFGVEVMADGLIDSHVGEAPFTD